MALRRYIAGLTPLLATLSPCLANASPTQRPLGGGEDVLTTLQPKSFTRIHQNDSICDAGSAHWTGTVSLGEGRDMFYWYFEKRDEPENAPLVVWVNGGPGGSSLLGTLFEVGPCTVSDAGDRTTKNPHSWTEAANVLFIDQPIGVGFSAVKNRDLWARDLGESTVDLSRFLDVFINEAFPELHGRPVHFAGESFGGNYVPIYAATTRRKFQSIILIDPLINWSRMALGLYEHLCIPAPLISGQHRFNASACDEMEKNYSACEKAAYLCELSYDADVCLAAANDCDSISNLFEREVVPGGWDPYDDRHTCDEPPICGGVGREQLDLYLNIESVQHALGFQDKFDYQAINMEFNQKWSHLPGLYIPTTREIAKILDVKETPVLVLNGMNDVGINFEGINEVLESILWSGHARFKFEKLQPWYYTDAKGSLVNGGTYKYANGLGIVNIREAGHMSPHDQPVGTLQLIKKWLAGEPW